MFTSSMNKNPLINLERNQLKNQKPQIPIGSKISLKMHEICELNEKERVERSYWHKKKKTLRNIWKKMTKNHLNWISQREREQKAF